MTNDSISSENSNIGNENFGQYAPPPTVIYKMSAVKNGDKSQI